MRCVMFEGIGRVGDCWDFITSIHSIKAVEKNKIL